MKTVVLASSKGGVGKTTLAFNLGVQAARSGRLIYLSDVDPQRSLMDLCQRRRETPELAGDNPMLLDGMQTVTSAVTDLTESGNARDFLIVDTSAAFMNVLREAISAADVIVMPLQASPLDILAQDAALDLIDKARKRDRLQLVLNRTEPRSSLTTDALKVMRGKSPNRPLRVANRIDYARAAVTARAAAEINREAAAEIGELWAAIERISRRRK